MAQIFKISDGSSFQDFGWLKFSRFPMAEVFKIFDGSNFQDF